MTAIHRTLATPVPQTQRLDPRQVRNAAGGYVFEVPIATAFERFLVIGTAGGTYYANERDHTRAGIEVCRQALAEMSPDAYAALVIESANVAVKRTYAIYAIAAALIHGSEPHRRQAPRMARFVCKNGTDVFELASYLRGQRGWGALVRKTFDEFFVGLDAKRLALWMVKYRDRFGFTWQDLIRLQHPTVPKDDVDRDRLIGWAARQAAVPEIPVVQGYVRARQLVGDHANEAELIEVIDQYRLPWEALTDEQRTPAVWKAAMPNIGIRAVIRNLGTFTRNGLADDQEFVLAVRERLLQQGPVVHPLNLLEALRTYSAGGATGRGAGGYDPVPQWVGALDFALENSFVRGVEETAGQRIFIGLDVSTSMNAKASGSRVLSCAEVGAAISLSMVKSEPWVGVGAFTQGLTPVPWHDRTTFTEALAQTRAMNFGGTDCSLPMIAAQQRGLLVDTFIVITDNETWAGRMHPVEALRMYRQGSKIDARLAVVALTATRHSIADPSDPRTIDISGFSSDLPQVLTAFMRMG